MTLPVSSRRRTAVLSAAALFLSAHPVPAQEKPSRAYPPFVRSVDVTVTNIDVVVTDSKGKRVTGLKKEDFQVLEDGAEREVTNFFAVEQGKVALEEEATPTPGPGAAPVPTPSAPPAPAAAPAPRTRIVIFVDNLHLTPFNRNRILRNVESFVRDAVKGEVEGMIVTWSRSLKIRRKFTSDGRDLADVLKQIEGESALRTSELSDRNDIVRYIDEDAQSQDEAVARVRQYVASLKNDLDYTIEALKSTVDELSGLEGRKILVHVSEGLPQSPGVELWKYIDDKFGGGTGSTAMMNSFEFDKTAGFASVVLAANAAGVTIYTIDAAGLTVDSNVTAEARSTTQPLDTFTERSNLQSMLSLMAEETGGEAILNRNDVTVPLREIEEDFTSYYSLGYRGPRSGSDRPHKLEVKVRRKGLTARARHSYVEKSADTKITEAVISGLYFPNELNPLAIGLEMGRPAPAGDGNFRVPVRLRIPFSRIALLPEGSQMRGRLVCYFIVIDADEKKSDLSTQQVPVSIDAKQVDAAAKRDFIYDVTLLMIPGNQRLSLAVRDEITNTVSYLQRSVFISAFAGEKKRTGTN